MGIKKGERAGKKPTCKLLKVRKGCSAVSGGRSDLGGVHQKRQQKKQKRGGRKIEKDPPTLSQKKKPTSNLGSETATHLAGLFEKRQKSPEKTAKHFSTPLTGTGSRRQLRPKNTYQGRDTAKNSTNNS